MLSGRNKASESSIAMLHTTMTAELKAVQTILTEGITRLESSTTSAQDNTRETVHNELSHLHSELRETKNQLLAANQDLSSTVDTVLTDLRGETRSFQQVLRELRALLDAGPPTAKPSESPSNNPGDPAPSPSSWAEPAATPYTEAEDASEPGSEPDTEARTAPDSAPPPIATAAERQVALTEQVTAAVRDALHSELEPVRETLEAMRHEIITLRAAAETHQDSTTADATDTDAWPDGHSRLAEASGTDQSETATLAAPTRLPAAHGQLLATASRISSIQLICHQEMWEYLAALAGPHPHWSKPGEVEPLPEDRVRAPLSGRSLIALLSVLHATESASREQDADWALAHTVYQRIAESMRRLDTVGERVTIALDDRAISPTTDDQASASTASPHEPPHRDDVREPAQDDEAA